MSDNDKQLAFDLDEPRVLTRDDLSAGRALADDGLRRAVAHTEAEHSRWSDLALAAFLAYGARHGGVFSTEDVRHANPQLPKPASATAWGAIPRRARALGKIEFGGYAPSKDPRSHGSPGNLWRWIA